MTTLAKRSTRITHRHPGTAMESDVEEDEDISEKYPGYKPGYIESPMYVKDVEKDQTKILFLFQHLYYSNISPSWSSNLHLL